MWVRSVSLKLASIQILLVEISEKAGTEAFKYSPTGKFATLVTMPSAGAATTVYDKSSAAWSTCACACCTSGCLSVSMSGSLARLASTLASCC